MFGREGLGWTEHHMAGIVDDDVEPAVVGDHRLNASLYRGIVADVEFDGSKIYAIFLGIGGDRGDLRRVASRGLAHRSVDGVTCLGERLGGQEAEARGRARDENDFLHGSFPLRIR